MVVVVVVDCRGKQRYRKIVVAVVVVSVVAVVVVPVDRLLRHRFQLSIRRGCVVVANCSWVLLIECLDEWVNVCDGMVVCWDWGSGLECKLIHVLVIFHGERERYTGIRVYIWIKREREGGDIVCMY